MKYELSQWHDGNVKPVHIGVYERRFGRINSDIIWVSLWTGKRWNWLYPVESKKGASKAKQVSYFQSMKWRGIIK